jgi:GNAT superfamily N-acetyltransferase
VSSPPVALRRASPADADALARNLIDAVADYPAFAPPGWSAPGVEAETEHLRAVLADPAVWCTVAEAGPAVVGQVTVLPAARAPHPVDDPALGHLSNLMVRRDLWGSGLARELHQAAVAGARERGLRTLRLFVAAGQARARRFYEREGWRAAGEPFDDPVPGLTMVEYRLRLAGADDSSPAPGSQAP